MELIRRALENAKPVLGVCLGSQLRRLRGYIWITFRPCHLPSPAPIAPLRLR